MKAISARATGGLNLGANLIASDNSGAKIVRLVSVKRSKAKKKKQVCGKIADWVKVSVRVGIPDMKGKVFDAVIIRQKKPFISAENRGNITINNPIVCILSFHLVYIFNLN